MELRDVIITTIKFQMTNVHETGYSLAGNLKAIKVKEGDGPKLLFTFMCSKKHI